MTPRSSADRPDDDPSPSELTEAGQLSWVPSPHRPDVDGPDPAPGELLPYVAPARGLPDAVEFSLAPTWRSGLVVLSAVVGIAIAGLEWSVGGPGRVRVELLLVSTLALLLYGLSYVRRTRIRIDGEGLVIRPRRYGFGYRRIRVPWVVSRGRTGPD